MFLLKKCVVSWYFFLIFYCFLELIIVLRFLIMVSLDIFVYVCSFLWFEVESVFEMFLIYYFMLYFVLFGDFDDVEVIIFFII